MCGLGSLAREGRYFQVELNSTCKHNDHSKLVLPISRPLNPLVKTRCIMMFVYHTNHPARVAENLPEFARVCKCEVQAPLHANNLISRLNRTVRARTMPISNWYCPYLDHLTICQNKLQHVVRVPYEPHRTCSREFARICPCAQIWALGSLARE